MIAGPALDSSVISVIPRFALAAAGYFPEREAKSLRKVVPAGIRSPFADLDDVLCDK